MLEQGKGKQARPRQPLMVCGFGWPRGAPPWSLLYFSALWLCGRHGGGDVVDPWTVEDRVQVQKEWALKKGRSQEQVQGGRCHMLFDFLLPLTW